MKLQNLTKLRKDHNVTGKQLAEHLNISFSQVYSYERGDSSPSIETLVLIAKFFNCSTDYVLGLTEIKNPEEHYKNKSFELIEQALKVIKADKGN